METYELADLTISQGLAEEALVFSSARLLIVSEYGTRLWYIDIEGMPDENLLQRFALSDNIGVDVKITTIGGRSMTGKGYFHPNPQHRAAAIRGDGQLAGYGHAVNDVNG